jgi:hypothetical protein
MERYETALPTFPEDHVESVVTCGECRVLVEAVQGIRGPYWSGRQRAGRRRSYRVGAVRDGAIIVSPAFFDPTRNDSFVSACARWVGHLVRQVNPHAHASALPAWIARLPRLVDFSRLPTSGTARLCACDHRAERRRSGGVWCMHCHRTCKPQYRRAAARVAAGALGVSVRSVYRAAFVPSTRSLG